MTEEEKKVIERIERKITIGKCEKNVGIPVYISELETLISLVEKQDTEINKLNNVNNELLKDKVYLEEENTKAWAKYWNAIKCISDELILVDI